jgi:hypothetical protein
LPIPSFIEGRSIAGQPAPEESRRNFTPTRHDPPQEPLEGPHQRAFDYSPEEQAIIEQRLADLGYLE